MVRGAVTINRTEKAASAAKAMSFCESHGVLLRANKGLGGVYGQVGTAQPLDDFVDGR